jgi:uncharacterized protein DUF402
VTPWRPGDVIVRREVLRGRPWAAIPVIVVRDDPSLLAVFLPEGAPFAFADGEWPGGLHPWHGRSAWKGHGLLMLQRPGDAYAVWAFWEGAERSFNCWYLNLQTPFRRTEIGIDTLDHELDLWSPNGHAWHWKDDELLDQRVQEGRFTPEEAARIRGEARRLEAELEEKGPWWDEGWASWEPDPAWPRPTLPDGWELV